MLTHTASQDIANAIVKALAELEERKEEGVPFHALCTLRMATKPRQLLIFSEADFGSLVEILVYEFGEVETPTDRPSGDRFLAE